MIADASFFAILTLTGLAFVPALAHKLRAPAAFVEAVRQYQLLPGALAPPAAIFLVVAELSTVALIAASLAGARAGQHLPGRLGLGLGGCLLALYGLAMSVNLARKRFGLDCGCSRGHMPISGGLALRNFGLALLAWAGAMISASAAQTLALGAAAGTVLFLACQTGTRILFNQLQGRMLSKQP